ncbi:putative membrane protein [Pedobacter sp. UYP30]|uniref:DUF1003 domain-containing protein n=1 Tax=Pedobacter sp. UYP30 TaxID=1756400 RepID=UPI003394329C
MKKQPPLAVKDIRSSLSLNLKLSDRVALRITNIFGSITFLIICAIIFLVWILWNTAIIPGALPFDKYPFPGLEMGVSIFAIILSVSVLISQNRIGRLEKTRQKVEFEVNFRAENEITKILQMLHEMQKKMGINTQDHELETMKENIDLQRLHEQIWDEEKNPDRED